MVSSRRADVRKSPSDRLSVRSHPVHIMCHSTRDGITLKQALKTAGAQPGLVHCWALDAVLIPRAQKRTRGGIAPPRVVLRASVERYGRLTVVPSPAFVMVNVPDVVLV